MASIIPTFRYRDSRAALEFLERAFGFERRALMENDDGSVSHAELAYGDGVVMLGTAGGGDARFDTGRGVTYVVVEDPDAHHDRAKAAGAEIVQELRDQDYGSREYAAADPEGNVWSFGTYDPVTG
jgi:uncharacterized glyoxalase superfamily protein PhnB